MNANQIFCSRCGKSNPSTNRFCNACGAALQMPAQPAVASQIPVRQMREDEAAWNPAAIAWISFLFTFIPAGVMCALNYERLGHPERKWKCLLGVIVAGILYIWFIAQIPDQVARGLWLLTLLVSLTYHSRQKEMFQRHLQAGGRKAPIGVPVALSILWVLMLVGGLMSWGAKTEARTQAQVDKIALASDALVDKSGRLLTRFDSLEKEIAGKDYIRDRAALKQLGQEQDALLQQAASQMRAAADKSGEFSRIENLSPELKEHASLFAQARRKRAESLDALRERAHQLANLGSQPVDSLHKKRAQLEQRANQLNQEATALEKQGMQAVGEDQPDTP